MYKGLSFSVVISLFVFLHVQNNNNYVRGKYRNTTVYGRVEPNEISTVTITLSMR